MATKRSVLITGCSDGGLGAALALAFHKKGFRVIATARNVAKLGQAKAAGIELLALDVLSQESIDKCVAETSALLDGKLDILVNNAGGGYCMPIMDIKLDAIRKLYDLNVFSPIMVSQAFLPLLRKSSQGVIVNNTSIASSIGPPMQSSYNSSKAAAAMITRNLRQELDVIGIKVVELKTGAVDTNFFANEASTNTDRLPDDSIYGIAKDEIEQAYKGDFLKKSISADKWAAQVVSDFGTGAPPQEIWRGTESFLARIVINFPFWVVDRQIRNILGLTAFEKKYKSQQATGGKA